MTTRTSPRSPGRAPNRRWNVLKSTIYIYIAVCIDVRCQLIKPESGGRLCGRQFCEGRSADLPRREIGFSARILANAT
jgi:hypothetical protein